MDISLHAEEIPRRRVEEAVKGTRESTPSNGPSILQLQPGVMLRAAAHIMRELTMQAAGSVEEDGSCHHASYPGETPTAFVVAHLPYRHRLHRSPAISATAVVAAQLARRIRPIITNNTLLAATTTIVLRPSPSTHATTAVVADSAHDDITRAELGLVAEGPTPTHRRRTFELGERKREGTRTGKEIRD